MRRAIELNTGVSFETWLKPFNQHLTNHSQSGTSLANCARSRRIRMAQVRVITRYQQNPFDLRPPKVGSRQLTDSHLGPGTSWDLLGLGRNPPGLRPSTRMPPSCCTSGCIRRIPFGHQRRGNPHPSKVGLTGRSHDSRCKVLRCLLQ